MPRVIKKVSIIMRWMGVGADLFSLELLLNLFGGCSRSSLSSLERILACFPIILDRSCTDISGHPLMSTHLH